MSTVQFDVEDDEDGPIEGSQMYDAAASQTQGEETQETTKTEDQVETLMLMERRRRRFYGADITPHLARVAELKEREKDKKLKLYQTMLTTAKADNITQKLKNLSDFDRSEAIIPHGQSSKKYYEEVFFRRPYDLYGRIRDDNELTEDKEAEMVAIARGMGLTYESDKMKADRAEREAIAATLPDPYDRNNLTLGGIKPPKIVTDKHNVGWREVTPAPPGFAEDPAPLPNSYGNEQFYSYDGTWQHGKMYGYGKYVYDDDGQYVGEWKDNRHDGHGKATYHSGHEYEGDWTNSRYCGIGNQIIRNGLSKYHGSFRNGRRTGVGKLEFRCGLCYEGEIMDGKPHGRGKMSSRTTGWSYDGHWNKGGIAGSGALITPPPENKRIVRYWQGVDKHPQQLSDAVKWYLEDKENTRYNEMMSGLKMFGLRRSFRLQQYVEAVKKEIHDARWEEKNRAREEALAKWKEQKEKLHEAKMRALAGIESDSDEEDGKNGKKKKKDKKKG